MTSFQKFLATLLLRTKMKPSAIKRYVENDYLKEFEIAFTHPTINPDSNYEFYEIIGDSVVNKSIVYYYQDRFPQLRNPKAVPFLDKLKQTGISKRSLSSFANKLNFLEHIRADDKTKKEEKNKILEDVFEAFCGCLELMINRDYYLVGSIFVYNFIKSVADTEHLSLMVEDLWDPKTRLKEFKDRHREKNPEIVEDKRDEEKKFNIILSFTVKGNKFFGKGRGLTKQDAEKYASKEIINELIRKGIWIETQKELNEVLGILE